MVLYLVLKTNETEYRFLGSQVIKLGNKGLMDMANLFSLPNKFGPLSRRVKVGHKVVKPWFIWSSGLGSGQASGFIDLSCLDVKGMRTKGKQKHQNSKRDTSQVKISISNTTLLAYNTESC